MLQTLCATLERDDSWQSRRRVVGTLVAVVEVSSHFDPCAPRGKAK
jgi:hypothetical protein